MLNQLFSFFNGELRTRQVERKSNELTRKGGNTIQRNYLMLIPKIRQLRLKNVKSLELKIAVQTKSSSIKSVPSNTNSSLERILQLTQFVNQLPPTFLDLAIVRSGPPAGARPHYPVFFGNRCGVTLTCLWGKQLRVFRQIIG